MGDIKGMHDYIFEADMVFLDTNAMHLSVPNERSTKQSNAVKYIERHELFHRTAFLEETISLGRELLEELDQLNKEHALGCVNGQKDEYSGVIRALCARYNFYTQDKYRKMRELVGLQIALFRAALASRYTNGTSQLEQKLHRFANEVRGDGVPWLTGVSKFPSNVDIRIAAAGIITAQTQPTSTVVVVSSDPSVQFLVENASYAVRARKISGLYFSSGVHESPSPSI